MGVKKFEPSGVSEFTRPLALVRKADQRPVAPEVVRSCKDMLGAFNLAINVSGLDEKEVYMALDIDPGQWSRMRKGDAHFPLNKLTTFCEVVQNEILLEFFAWSQGKGLHMLESEAQRQLREAQEALSKEKEKTQMLADLLAGRQTR